MNLWQMQGNTLGPFFKGLAMDNKGKMHSSIHHARLQHKGNKVKVEETET